MKELTGQDIHEAYNRALVRDALRKKAARAVIVTEWEDVSEENKHLYNRMALYLNVIAKNETQTRRDLDAEISHVQQTALSDAEVDKLIENG